MTEVPKPEPKKTYSWSHVGRSRAPRCTCGAPSVFSQYHNAYYCGKSRTWLEATCNDEKCIWCSSRPEVAPAVTSSP